MWEDNYFVANYPLARSLMVDLITFQGKAEEKTVDLLVVVCWARFYGNLFTPPPPSL